MDKLPKAVTDYIELWYDGQIKLNKERKQLIEHLNVMFLIEMIFTLMKRKSMKSLRSQRISILNWNHFKNLLSRSFS
ncbi:hypothetical protein ACUW9N_002182 [Staphylococcus auricularis]|nr:hypothetical protein [Staphylococcus auricularis]